MIIFFIQTYIHLKSGNTAHMQTDTHKTDRQTNKQTQKTNRVSKHEN